MSHRPTRRQREREEQMRRQREATETKVGEDRNASVGIPEYIRGLPPGLILAGIAFFLTPYFWFGVLLTLVGSLCLARNLWKDLVVAKRSRVSRIAFVLVSAASFVGFTVWIWWPVPIELNVNSTIPDYGPGSNLYGIQWSKEFSRLDFDIKNPTDVDYDGFDAEISSDLTFEGVRQTDGLITCAIAPASKVIRPTVQKTVGGIPVGPHKLEGGVPVGPVETDSKQYQIVGVSPDGEMIFSGETARRYRIRATSYRPTVKIHLSLRSAS